MTASEEYPTEEYYKRYGGKRAPSRRIKVKFLDNKTGKIREFEAKVKRSKYASTAEMVKGMDASNMHPEMIVQAVMKREKIGKAAAKKHVLKIKPSLEKKFNKKAPAKRKSSSKSKKRKSTRVSRRNQGGARTQRQSRWW